MRDTRLQEEIEAIIKSISYTKEESDNKYSSKNQEN